MPFNPTYHIIQHAMPARVVAPQSIPKQLEEMQAKCKVNSL